MAEPFRSCYWCVYMSADGRPLGATNKTPSFGRPLLFAADPGGRTVEVLTLEPVTLEQAYAQAVGQLGN